VGSPEDLYERPATRFVAGFVGRASALPGIYEDGKVRLPSGEAWPGIPAGDLKPGEPAELVVRPESLAFVQDGLPGRITERRYAGPVSYYQVALDGHEVEVMAPSGSAAEGDAVSVGLGTSGPRPRIFGVGKS
jgi:ABC-type Fe3+/spermidine/putrescine transport system ATPase subunit